ncbi:MAG: purine permease [Desulfobacterium sp.]|nr:purine permease [Desulfobacterium sp.]
MADNGINLIAGVDDKLRVRDAFFMGLQHVLAMDLYIVPIIISGILALSTSDTAFLIQMTFLAAGLATLIQTGFGIKLPVMQGPSYVPIGAVVAIGKGLGMAAVMGAMIPGALIIALLGKPLRQFGGIVRRIIPPIVGGTVIIVVGIALMPIAIQGVYTAHGDIGTNCLVGVATASLLVFFTIFGTRLKGIGQMLRLVSVLLSLSLGTLMASFFGMVDFTPVASAAWVALPRPFPFGPPTFDLYACLTMAFIYFVVLVETTGTWFAVSAVTGKELDNESLNGGAMGEGLGCLIGSLFGGLPVTGYSTNAGIIAITGVASRWAVMAGGVILIALGLMPKLTSLIACIPEPVICGVFGVICVIIAMNGFRVVRDIPLDERSMLVIGLPILVTLAAVLMPKELLYSLPRFAGYLLSSGIAVGAVSAIIFNLILPEQKVEQGRVGEQEE